MYGHQVNSPATQQPMPWVSMSLALGCLTRAPSKERRQRLGYFFSLPFLIFNWHVMQFSHVYGMQCDACSGREGGYRVWGGGGLYVNTIWTVFFTTASGMIQPASLWGLSEGGPVLEDGRSMLCVCVCSIGFVPIAVPTRPQTVRCHTGLRQHVFRAMRPEWKGWSAIPTDFPNLSVGVGWRGSL